MTKYKQIKIYKNIVVLWLKFVANRIAIFIEATSCRRNPSGIQRITRRLDCHIVYTTRSKTWFCMGVWLFLFLLTPLPFVKTMLYYAHCVTIFFWDGKTAAVLRETKADVKEWTLVDSFGLFLFTFYANFRFNGHKSWQESQLNEKRVFFSPNCILKITQYKNFFLKNERVYLTNNMKSQDLESIQSVRRMVIKNNKSTNIVNNPYNFIRSTSIWMQCKIVKYVAFMLNTIRALRYWLNKQ